MKKNIFIILVPIIFLLHGITKAQDINHNPASLGILCHLTVDINNVPTERGYAKYPISQPPEGFGYYGDTGTPPMGKLDCIGLRLTYLDLFDYNNPILNVYIRDFEVIPEDAQYVYLDIPVKSYVYNLGMGGSERVQAYYTIILVLIR